jgi:hypothetical protein
MDQNSLTRGGGSLTAFVRPSEKIIGDVDVDARHYGRFGRERPLITKMRRNGLRKQYLLHCCEPIARYLVPFYIGAQGAEADEPIAPIFHRNPKERARLFGSADSGHDGNGAQAEGVLCFHRRQARRQHRRRHLATLSTGDRHHAMHLFLRSRDECRCARESLRKVLIDQRVNMSPTERV